MPPAKKICRRSEDAQNFDGEENFVSWINLPDELWLSILRLLTSSTLVAVNIPIFHPKVSKKSNSGNITIETMNSLLRTRQWNSRDGTNIQNPFSLEKVTSETRRSSQNAKRLSLEQISCIIILALILIYSKL